MTAPAVFQCDGHLCNLPAFEERQTLRMFRNPGKVLAFAMAAASLLAAGARAADEEALAIVTGIAPGDLLNVRASASPFGHVMARLDNGTAVRNRGCSDFGGYQWCKVEVVNQPNVGGWVPQRYLLAVDPEGTATPSLDEADIRQGSANAAAPAPAEQGDASAAAAGRPADENPAAVAVPPNLAARLGDGAPHAAADEKAASSNLTEAYRVALAAEAKAAAGEGAGADDTPGAKAATPDRGQVDGGQVGSAPETPAASGAADAAETEPEAATDAVPLPTPRPAPSTGEQQAPEATKNAAGTGAVPAPPAAPATEAEATPEPQIVALADPQAPAPAWDATGEIPCARYVGQPMTRCRVGVRRAGAGKADVTVVWPDGGARVIGFYDGKPAGANARGAFRFTREGDLNMIRVGVSERFEITDALAFGD